MEPKAWWIANVTTWGHVLIASTRQQAQEWLDGKREWEGSSGSLLRLRAITAPEMDALHACGHDVYDREDGHVRQECAAVPADIARIYGMRKASERKAAAKALVPA